MISGICQLLEYAIQITIFKIYPKLWSILLRRSEPPYVDVVDGGKMMTKDFIGKSGVGNREVYKDFILVSTGKLAS